MKRQNAVSGHLRTNLPRDHSAAHTHSDRELRAVQKGAIRVDQPSTRKTNRLQIAVRLAPAIFIDDICKRDTADRPKPAHRVADWQ
jgi:hypothetical protein